MCIDVGPLCVPSQCSGLKAQLSLITQPMEANFWNFYTLISLHKTGMIKLVLSPQISDQVDVHVAYHWGALSLLL